MGQATDCGTTDLLVRVPGLEMIQQLCKYCSCDLGRIEGESRPSEILAHGLCAECYPRFVAGTGVPFDDFLDALPRPVFVVSPEGRILSANRHACDLMSSPLEQLRGKLGGEAFECVHAREPLGCGRGVHCRTCAVRIAVLDTYNTGVPRANVPACMDLADVTGQRRVRFLISTRKVDGVVLLAIEGISPD